MSTVMRRLHPSVLVGCLIPLCLVIATATPTAQGRPGQVVVFGDSLSDPGNGFFFLRTNATPPDYGMNALLVPDSPYAIGGHHLTNGPTWIEQLASSHGMNRSVLPAFANSSPYAMNFAVATARARDDGANPSLALEVGAFLQKTGGVASSNALYVIEIGGDDVRDALVAALSGDVPGADAILYAAAQAVAANIDALYAAGARRFLIWNVPDLGLTPTARLLGAKASAAATSATEAFNWYLQLQMVPVSALSGITLIPFNAAALFDTVVANPSLFGLTNVTDSCVTPLVAPFQCHAADDYLFWDGIHPTRAGHALIAGAVASLLGL
jgi:outer membrane lipase/esterase